MRACRFDEEFTFPRVVRARFFNVCVFAGLAGEDRGWCMPVIRRRANEGIDFRIVEDLAEIADSLRRRIELFQALDGRRQTLAVDFAYVLQSHARQAGESVRQRHPPAEPHDADRDRVGRGQIPGTGHRGQRRSADGKGRRGQKSAARQFKLRHGNTSARTRIRTCRKYSGHCARGNANKPTNGGPWAYGPAAARISSASTDR